MADLRGFLDVGGATDAPGFLVPVFHAYPGANALSIQIVDDRDRVAGFHDVEAVGISIDVLQVGFELQPEDAAIWAFRDADGFVHFGDASTLAATARRLLAMGALQTWPLFAAELVLFFRLAKEHGAVLVAAFNSLSERKSRAAAVWRDSQVFAPAVRRDLAIQWASIQTPHRDSDLVVLTRGEVVEIHVSEPWPAPGELYETLMLMEAFGLDQIRVVELLSAGYHPPPDAAQFLLAGVGGIAQSVLQAPRFRAQPIRWQSSAGGALGLGFVTDWNDEVVPKVPLYVAMSQSDFEHLEVVLDVARAAPTGAVQHLIHVRPIGYGPIRREKVDLVDLREQASTFQLVWIIANHRHRGLGVRSSNLAASSYASRIVASLLVSILTRHGHLPDLQWLNGGRRDAPVFCLTGTTRVAKGEARELVAQRLLHAMACEEAELRTAKSIVIHLPHTTSDDGFDEIIKFGGAEYLVTFLSRIHPGRSREAIAWALDVKLAEGRADAYGDFCIDLMAGYGWSPLRRSDTWISFQRRGDAIRIWPINSLESLHALIWDNPEYDRPNEIIVTNQTITPELIFMAEEKGWRLLHHAEIGRWMADEFPT